MLNTANHQIGLRELAHDAGDGGRAELLVQNAEAALNRAKRTGEQYLAYEGRMRSESAERLRLEHRLRTALEAEQFVLLGAV